MTPAPPRSSSCTEPAWLRAICAAVMTVTGAMVSSTLSAVRVAVTTMGSVAVVPATAGAAATASAAPKTNR
ncbi:MAG: hypothetical protein M5U09_08385 [Gammaproteobacteria bacterium]|nr:hypothetical protein [Gammaproteobacteria bacterium]